MVAAQALVACYIPYAAAASFMCGVIISLARWLRSGGFTGYADPPSALGSSGGLRWFAGRALTFSALGDDRLLINGARMLHWALLATAIFHMDLVIGTDVVRMNPARMSILAVALGAPTGSVALAGLVLLLWRRIRPRELASPICNRRVRVQLPTSPSVLIIHALLAAVLVTGIAQDVVTVMGGGHALALASSWALSFLAMRPDAAAIAALPLLDVHVILASALVALLPWSPLRHFLSYALVPDLGQVG
ncbi:MAG: respiratory nitrate reductase subunit gamma [Conexivisphaerales archaeon]|nr:respiratory nitrate reductase subunit gamma [Conexivisphaerales archaeon]